MYSRYATLRVVFPFIFLSFCGPEDESLNPLRKSGCF